MWQTFVKGSSSAVRTLSQFRAPCSSNSKSTLPRLSSSASRNWPSKFPRQLPLRLNWNGQFLNADTQQLWGTIHHLPEHHKRVAVSATLTGPATTEIAANLFQLATAFVVPFYTAMILAPKWKRTQQLIESELTYFILGAAYIYLLFLSWTPETLGLMFSSKYWLPELSGISRMFTSTVTVASAWLHLLAADLFAGRQVFLDGVKHKVETRHSLVLCLMMCPIGIFSHLVTKSVVLFLRRIRIEGSKVEATKRNEGIKVEATNEFSPY